MDTGPAAGHSRQPIARSRNKNRQFGAKGGKSSMTIRLSRFAAAALLTGVLASILSGTPASAQELVYGSWTAPREYQNVHVMPELFKNIEKETNGAVKWKLIAGGAIADGKGTFAAVKDGLMQGGLGIVTYAPNTIPSVYAIYSTVILGHNDVVAA